jgi:excisionase family DNA binding protein
MADRLRTYSEAAEEMRVPLRTLRALVSRHKPPVLQAGRRVLFDEAALYFLREALRRPCPSSSPAAPGRHSGGSRELSAEEEFAKALELTTPSWRKKSGRLARQNSSATST